MAGTVAPARAGARRRPSGSTRSTSALLTSGRTEDDMLADMQLRVDERRASLLQDCPWLRSGKDAASHALP